MPINIIACVTNYKNKLAIGRSNGLLFKLQKDIEFFKTVTITNGSSNFGTFKNERQGVENIIENIVLMGRKTWFSISRERRPLKNRLNLILTNDPELLRVSPLPKSPFNNLNKSVYFLTFEQFVKFYNLANLNVYVIGGSEIYDLFLKPNYVEKYKLKPSRVYLTEVYDYKPEQNLEPDCFMTPLDQSYKLISISEKQYDKGYDLHYRFLQYITDGEPTSRCENMNCTLSENSSEKQYLDLAKTILENGKSRPDRTGVGTISSFGHKMEFDISETVPLLTTKRVPWKSCIEELLWFMRGDTDAKILQRRGVKIWDGNTSREFLDSRGLNHYDDGILGKGYGWQWRFFGAKYSQAFADTSCIDRNKIGGFDQLAYIEYLLKSDPFSRRIMMSYWNPPDFDKTALNPCHFSCQFYVREQNGEKFLSCLFNMRSNDLFLGNPFNIFSYAVLTYILAIRCDMKPDKLIYMGGDVHIYQNHISQIKEQLQRSPRSAPKLIIKDDVKYKQFHEMTISDFDIVGYFPHPPIKAPMAV